MSRVRLILNQEHADYPTGPIQNVFYYEDPSVTFSAQDLAEAFETAVLDRLATIQNASVTYTSIEALDLDDPSNFGVWVPTTTVQGAVVDLNILPAFMATSFQLIRASYASRHGWKRFTGLSETMLAAGQLEAAYLNSANLLATRLTNTISLWPVGTCQPRIARRPGPGQPLSDTVLFPIQSAVYRGITTQNSRKA